MFNAGQGLVPLKQRSFQLGSVGGTTGEVILMEGVVKWFNTTKGYGFITPSDGGRDIFVHHTDIQGEGHKRLNEGARVEFEILEEDKGPKATNVRLIGD